MSTRRLFSTYFLVLLVRYQAAGNGGDRSLSYFDVLKSCTELRGTLGHILLIENKREPKNFTLLP